MIRFIGILLALSITIPAYAQEWQLKESGVGLIICDGEYDTRLKIAQRGDVWDAKSLYESGALSGRCDGSRNFSAWIQGPHTKEYLNSNGLPIWSYKYRITYPDGKSFESGPHGFYAPGFATTSINTSSYREGNWKIDWYIVHRDTRETRHVATNAFRTTWGGQQDTAGTDWKVKDIGVGLIICDGEYDTRLKIAQRGGVWDAKFLYESGALSGRCDGNRSFSAWIQGPHTKEYLNSNGLPIWSYKYRITYPDGKGFESGPHGFYTPGFATVGINPSGYQSGSWKIDWYIVHRDTRETRHVGSSEFALK